MSFGTIPENVVRVFGTWRQSPWHRALGLTQPNAVMGPSPNLSPIPSFPPRPLPLLAPSSSSPRHSCSHLLPARIHTCPALHAPPPLLPPLTKERILGRGGPPGPPFSPRVPPFPPAVGSRSSPGTGVAAVVGHGRGRAPPRRR